MGELSVARVLFPVRTLGPGERLGIWLYGCDRGCAGCANPELWNQNDVALVRVDFLLSAITKMDKIIEGVTITGGEPLQQCEALNELLDGILMITEDVLLYTGYRMEELDDAQRAVCLKASVIIDGAYIQEQNRGHPLKGSENQNIYYRDDIYRQYYEEYVEKVMNTRITQTFRISGGVVVPGIHEAGFMGKYRERIKNRLGDEQENG